MRIFLSVIILTILLVACAGPDGTVDVVENNKTTQNAQSKTDSEQVSETKEELDLSENKFIATIGKDSTQVKAVYDQKIKEFVIESIDPDLIVFDLKDKYSASLEYIRQHLTIDGKSYSEYKESKVQGEAEKKGKVKPKTIQVEILESQNKAKVDILFPSGNTDSFTLNTKDKDEINFDLADRFSIPVLEVRDLVTYYGEGQVKTDIKELGEKVDAGLKEKIVEKSTGSLRSVGCDYLSEPTCGADGTVKEFEPGKLYRCTKKEKGIYWMGEDERYSDKMDLISLEVIGAHDQIRFKCE
ncbi:hypothetical protein J4457_07385 [Candidatus Woesearchaeota archaeon]|nr:hypothetical protein [Candidatus Woesearchaeota archaeon]